MESSVLVAIQFFFTMVVSHIILCRISPSRFMFKGLFLGVIFFLICVFFQLRDGALDLVCLYLLGSAWLAYLMFFINLLNSVTLKMLEALSESKRGILLNNEFSNLFSEESGLQSRVKSMVENGFLEPKGEELALTFRSRFMVFWVNLLRNIFAMND